MKVLELRSLTPQPPTCTRSLASRDADDGAVVADATSDAGPDVAVLFAEGGWKVRRIALPEGAVIPPCRMEHDVVFVVLEGRVLFTTGQMSDGGAAVELAKTDAVETTGVTAVETAEVAAPGAVFVAGGATARSMRALTGSLVLAVLCRPAETSASQHSAETRTSSAGEDAS